MRFPDQTRTSDDAAGLREDARERRFEAQVLHACALIGEFYAMDYEVQAAEKEGDAELVAAIRARKDRAHAVAVAAIDPVLEMMNPLTFAKSTCPLWQEQIARARKFMQHPFGAVAAAIPWLSAMQRTHVIRAKKLEEKGGLPARRRA